MDKRLILYWLTTALIAFAFAAGGGMDFALTPPVVEAMHHLGYPDYFARLIGFWKVLGAIAITVPGIPRIKEWVYAGMFFDLTGAAVSHAALGDSANAILTPLVLTALLVASWALRPKSRVLGELLPAVRFRAAHAPV